MKNILKKIKIPRFFKTKKFFILLFLFLLFFLFTPISLHQIDNKVENFLNNKAHEGLKTFEKQTGLKIEWQDLNFNIFTMSANLKEVKITPSNSPIQTFDFLNGLQKIKKISARPSVYSLLFEKQIILAKLKIQKGDIHLKTLKSFIKKPKQQKEVALPIKKLLITNTNLNIKNEEHNLIFSQVKAQAAQKDMGVFRFDLSVNSFNITKNLNPNATTDKKDIQKNQEEWEKESFELSFKGLAQKNRVSFEKISLKNKDFQSFTDWLDIHFDSKGLKSVGVKSSGSLPSFLLQKAADLMDEKLPAFDILSFYNFNIQYKKNKGFQGFFELEAEQAIFKSKPLKKIFIKGNLINYTLAIDKGLIKTQNQGRIDIKKGKWLFKADPLQFSFSMQADKLSFDFVFKTILDLQEFPVRGDFTGSIHCLGLGQGSFLKCITEGKSERLIVHPENRDEILSFHEMNFKSDIEWNQKILKFDIYGEKSDFSKASFKGKYFQDLNKIEAEYSFLGTVGKDLKFNTEFPIQGELKTEKGFFILDKDKLTLTGFMTSPALKIQSYRLANISSAFSFKNNKLNFSGIRGGASNKTNYIAECEIDFEKDQLIVKSEFPFFDVEDFLEAVQENIPWPLKLKGTGTASFAIKYPWSSPEQYTFQLKGNLFNIFINKDFFQQAIFDLGLEDQKGIIRSLLLKKGQGAIRGKGTFNSKHALNLDLTGQNLSLERLEWLNEILSFNQSGDVNFNAKITGTANNPKFNGHVLISNMLFYAYPVSNSNIKLKINKSGLSFSGNITDEISIENFIYPFSNTEELGVKGRFINWNFIKLFFSKNHIENIEDYSSKINGSFSFFQKKGNLKSWSGFAKIDNFLISKSSKWIKNTQPFSISLDEKKWSLSPTWFSHQDDKTLKLENRENDKLLLSGESSLDLFSVFFPFLKEFDGNIKGQLLIDNNLKQLNPRGSLHIERGAFSIEPLPDLINIKTSLIFAKNNVFINDFNGNAGGGLVKGEGAIFYDFINAPRLNLSLSLSNTRLNIPEDFNTKGSGTLHIQGEKAPYLISGQYEIDSGNIVKDFSESAKKTKYDFSFLDEKEVKQKSLFALKLNIKTNKAVDVNSSLIRSSIEGQADIYGPLESLLINGQFNLSQKAEENLIFFRGHEFKISSGSIFFKNSVPENPYLNIKANTLFKENIVDFSENQEEIEREYNIFLSLKGSSKNPSFSLESIPSLNEKEIISLLTLGIRTRRFDTSVTENVTDADYSSQISYSSQLVASMLLEKPLNKEIKNTLGLDFRLTPYINTDNKPVTKITLSRNWFEKWKTSFSRTLHEDAESDIRLKYNLNKKVSLTAFWESEEKENLDDDQKERLGLDLEFNFDF